MRAAAGLQVDAGDPQEPHAPGAARRLHAHRLDELRPRVELLVGDPDRLGLDAARDHRVRLALDLRGVEQAHVDVEIEPRLVRRDVAAGDRRDDDARHHVQRRVQAHQRVAPAQSISSVTVSPAAARRAGAGDVHARCRAPSPLRVSRSRCARRSSRTSAPVSPAARRPRIEDRAVELDAALVRRDDPRRRGLQVRSSLNKTVPCSSFRAPLVRRLESLQPVASGTDYYLARQLLRAGNKISAVPNSVVETAFQSETGDYVHQQARWLRNLVLHSWATGDRVTFLSALFTWI